MDDNGTNQLMDKARDVRKDLTELGSLAVDAAKERAVQMKDGAGDMHEPGCAQAKLIQNEATNYIRREPLKARFAAGTPGLVIGWLLTRRSK